VIPFLLVGINFLLGSTFILDISVESCSTCIAESSSRVVVPGDDETDG
jgi:hypothetical protein